MKKILTLATILLLLTPILAMSDDGGNEPIKEKKQVTHPVQSVASETKEVKSIESVKDQYGTYTGMSAVKLAKFKEEYMKLERQMFPNTRTAMLYNAKINLNKYDELRRNGVDLNRAGSFIDSKSYLENALYSEIVVIGITTEQTKEKSSVYKIEVEEVLKGSDILIAKFGKVPEFIYYYTDINEGGISKPILNHKGIYYLWNSKRINKNRRWFQKRDESTLLLLPDSTVLYEKYYDKLKSLKWLRNKKNKSEQNKIWQKGFEKTIIMSETWKEAVENVKTILKINNADNFYKKTFKVEVEK